MSTNSREHPETARRRNRRPADKPYWAAVANRDHRPPCSALSPSGLVGASTAAGTLFRCDGQHSAFEGPALARRWEPVLQIPVARLRLDASA